MRGGIKSRRFLENPFTRFGASCFFAGGGGGIFVGGVFAGGRGVFVGSSSSVSREGVADNE